MNIGNPIEHSILDFARIIKTEVGGDSNIVHLDEVQDDPKRRRPDISLAKKVSNSDSCHLFTLSNELSVMTSKIT